MARFPESYGSIDIAKIHGAQLLDVTFSDGTVRQSLVVPVDKDWMTVTVDAQQAPHAYVDVEMSDAQGLNKYLADKASSEGKSHNDFNALIHVMPKRDYKKMWRESILSKLKGMRQDEVEKMAAKLRLDRQSIAQSDYYQKNPSRIPTPEQVMERIAYDEIRRATSAGRITAPSLLQPVAQSSGAAVAAPMAAPAPAPAFPPQAPSFDDPSSAPFPPTGDLPW